MRPASTTPALVYSYKPENHRKLKSGCQDRFPFSRRGFSLPSRFIFLLNFDPPYRERLAFMLRRLGYEVFIPEEHGILLRDITDKEFQQADFILFDLTRLNHDTVWLPLRRICQLRKEGGMPLMVHCFSRIDRGPEFYLMVEKLGARMGYYAEQS
jgi:hypothetical protein